MMADETADRQGREQDMIPHLRPASAGIQAGMRLLQGALLALLLAAEVAGPAGAQSDQEMQDYDRRVVDLVRAGKKAQAATVAREAVEVAQQRYGADSLVLAQQLDHLATVLRMDRDYAQAELLIKRALAIREKEFGQQHTDICQSLSNLAVLYETQGRLADMEPLLRRSLAIREQAWGTTHPAVGHTLHELAKLYRQMGRSAEAETLFGRAVTILGSGHPAVFLEVLARGDYEAAALMHGVAAQPDARAAVRKTFFGQVTRLRWTGLRMAGEADAPIMVIVGEAMHGNDIWQPFEVDMAADGQVWKMRSIRVPPMAWR
jgi:tetratricopeptide (TPR) repeat protein